MTRLCLDTSGYSRFRTGDARAVELLDGATWVGVPAILLGELRSGFLGGDRRAWNEQALGLPPGTLTWRGPFAPDTDEPWRRRQAMRACLTDLPLARSRS